MYAHGSDLYWVKEDGTNARKLVTVAGVPFGCAQPRMAACCASQSLILEPTLLSLWEVSADGSNLHPLLPGWNEPAAECCGNWSPDGKYFAFQSSRNGRSNIWVLTEKSNFLPLHHGPSQLTAGPMNFTTPVFSGDSEKLFVLGEQRRGEVVRYDTKAHQFLPLPLRNFRRPSGLFAGRTVGGLCQLSGRHYSGEASWTALTSNS